MEITMTVGARYLPQSGLLAASREVWSERVPAAPSACRLRVGRSFPGAFHRALINPIGIDLPVTDRMHRSASEP